MQRGKRYRDKITIETATASSKNSYGERVYTTAQIDKVWATVTPLSAREILEGGGVDHQITHRVEMRHHAGMSCRVPGSVQVTVRVSPVCIPLILSWVRMTGIGQRRLRAFRVSITHTTLQGYHMP